MILIESQFITVAFIYTTATCNRKYCLYYYDYHRHPYRLEFPVTQIYDQHL